MKSEKVFIHFTKGKNKAGPVPIQTKNKKDKKIAKCKKEDPHDTSGGANKKNENIIPQQAEQTKKGDHTLSTEEHGLPDTNVKKQNCDEMEKGTLPSNEKSVQTGRGGFTEDNFFENIDNMLGLPKRKANSWNTNGWNNRTTEDSADYMTKGKTCELPEEEIMAEPSDPLRDELLALYRRNPNTSSKNLPIQTLNYVKKFYQEIYENKPIDRKVASELTKKLTQVFLKQNYDLTKSITEEVSQVINKLPNNKAPDSDGLTYEFYKDTRELIVLLLTKLFNEDLSNIKIGELDTKLQREDAAAVETPTPPLEFSSDNPYINRNKSEEPVNKLSSTDMDLSNDYEPVNTDMKTQNLKKGSSIEIETTFTNALHGEIKIRDMDGYEEPVKKYLQVGQPYKVHGNTLHSTPVTSNQH
ncbi:3747_t:CDS:2 [Gigaspora margarita]|uniref:3747_t:CDS:1 n=1 Tax=Gigaspora margarita TaxID=4874 RepID=A0ABN7UNU2_GIGMA|nr:3747_t:CDS:2 [Gigaspora margarita]